MASAITTSGRMSSVPIVSRLTRGRSTTHAVSESVVTVLDPDSSTSSTRKIASVPSVVTIAGTRPHETMTPLIDPRTPPKTRHSTITSSGGRSWKLPSRVPTP
jgi:hypothetical protein